MSAETLSSRRGVSTEKFTKSEAQDDHEADPSIDVHNFPLLAQHDCGRVWMLTPVFLNIAVAVSATAGAGSTDWQRVPRYT